MLYLRAFLHALVLPKIYVAYLLITLAPHAAKEGPVLPQNDYYVGVGLLLGGLLLLFYGSFVTARYKWLPVVTRARLAWAFIGVTILLDSAIIYYLLSISRSDSAFLTLLVA
jgi:hypothetical protein